MVFGMATRKITITLPEHQIDEIRTLVAAGAADSVSAFLKHAVGVALFDAAGW
jgi:Arc/MetJ-type ribon-helix-helix transcriptional regulator